MKLKKIVICFLVCIFTNDQVIFAETTTESTQSVSQEMVMSEAQLLSEQLLKLKEVDSFKTEFSFINQRSQETMAQITILANQETGNAQIQFNFSNRQNNPRYQQVTLYAYNHFEKVYVSVADWLLSMAYFEQPYFKNGDTTAMQQFEETYVELLPTSIEGVDQLADFHEAFVLLPNLKLLEKADEQYFHQIGDFYSVVLERTQIPELILSDTNHVSFEYRTEINNTLNNIQILPKIKASNFKDGLELKTSVNSKHESDLLKEIKGLSKSRSLPNLDQELGISTTSVSEKLTDFNLTLNSDSLRYKLELGGLNENFNLNLFKDTTASVKVYEFELIYQFQPYDWEMPDEATLNIYSSDDWEMLVNETLKINEGQE